MPATDPAHAPYFRACLTARGMAVDGEHTALFGHKLPDSALGRPDGIYAGWHWDGAGLAVENDRYSFYPLFYCAGRDSIAVSPSLTRILALGAPRTLDEDGLAVFLRLGFFVGEDTPFKHIKVLPPDCTFRWEAGSLTVSGHYAFGREDAAISREQALDGYVEYFRRAIARRLPGAGERVAVPISGGRDSRHILLELLHQDVTPEICATAGNKPPRPDEDLRVAKALLDTLGLPQTIARQRQSWFAAERRKNVALHFCADENAWLHAVADDLAGRGVTTVYDGIAGDVLSTGYWMDERRLRAWATGDEGVIADELLKRAPSAPGFNENALRYLLTPATYARLSYERARARLAQEVGRHWPAPDPIDSFYFWTRARREIALAPYAVMAGFKTHAPYLDHELFDFLTSLPPAMLADHYFHSEAIVRGYPAAAHVPFEDKQAQDHKSLIDYAAFARALARHWLPRPRSQLMRDTALRGRLLACLLSRGYAARTQWFTQSALYLYQLEEWLRGERPPAPRPDG